MSDTNKDPAESAMTIGEGAGTTHTDAVETPGLPPRTDLRVDWGDACCLAHLPDLNQIFLLIMHKGTGIICKSQVYLYVV